MKLVLFYPIWIRSTQIRACYGRYSSFRIAKVGMQKSTELFQYILCIQKSVYLLQSA